MVRQYVTTMMTSGMKKATKEPISMKRSSLRTQLPLTKTLSSLWRPITGIGIDTPRWRKRERETVSKRNQCFSCWHPLLWVQIICLETDSTMNHKDNNPKLGRRRKKKKGAEDHFSEVSVNHGWKVLNHVFTTELKSWLHVPPIRKNWACSSFPLYPEQIITRRIIHTGKESCTCYESICYQFLKSVNGCSRR